MKAHVIQIVLSLTGLLFLVGGDRPSATAFMASAFVVWALKRDDA